MTTNDKIIDALLFDSEEEREDEHLFCMNALVGYYMEQERKQRPSFYVRDRLEWSKHVDELLEEGNDVFARLYRMSYDSFRKLCAIIHGKVEVDEEMSRIRTSKGPKHSDLPHLQAYQVCLQTYQRK
jgi:hypothetical protein